MSEAKSGTTARAIADSVLGRSMTREIWTGNYDKVLPISVQAFDVTAMLPAVFFMFRFGHRRGTGCFAETFGGEGGTIRDKKRAATIERVAGTLALLPCFQGFEDETERAILGDLLLSFCLENAKRALGRNEQVQRVAPAHYMASWVDLPRQVSDLRFVPEMLVAMLADQRGDSIVQNADSDTTWFTVGRGFQQNVLLRAFHKGIVRGGQIDTQTSDKFEEGAEVGLDQLLAIRLAQRIGRAPDKLKGKESGGDRISNQRPIAERAAQRFSEDLRHFIRAYAPVIPRHAFVELLESCIAIGLTAIVTSVVEIVFEWADTGVIRDKSEQRPAPLFVDASNGVDRRLRALAEQSMDDFMRRFERFPVTLMVLRLLDYEARNDPALRKLEMQTRPYATAWLNLLGDLLHGRREESRDVLRDFGRTANKLADGFETEYPEAAKALRDGIAQNNAVWSLAETLTTLQARSGLSKPIQMVDSSLLANRPNGLAMKRSVTRAGGGGRKQREVRSIVFTDSVLDYLVHLHVLRGAKKSGYRPLAFTEFLDRLRDNYGFFVDAAPPGLTVSNDLLRENRGALERRLRDLGLLVGVNDAESMKHLRPRFEPSVADDHELE
ncbi:MAG: hypothetical protein ACREHD_02205 [Pirellulales bacterium]